MSWATRLKNGRDRDNAIEMLNGRLASLEHERENHRKISAQAQAAAAEFSALAGKSENEQIAKLFAALKDEAAKYGELLEKHEELNLKVEFLSAEKARALAEAGRLARENTALSSGAEQKAGELLQGRNEAIKELMRKIKSMEESLSAERGKNAGLLKAAEDEKTGVLVELKRSEEETAAVRDRQRSLEHELGDTAEKWRP
ncbi:MAG: hypothetical protein HY796_08320 [Elusimicrobia bacterium]|nr:hypothetical protein [Elusimicrobiota bacterium]